VNAVASVASNAGAATLESGVVFFDNSFSRRIAVFPA